MPCFGPMIGWRAKNVNPKTGKRPITFKKDEAFMDMKVIIPCGMCDGCMIDRTREWATRCVNEASMYENNCFVTLTYNDENLPIDGSIRKSEVSEFMKRLRQSNRRTAEKLSKELNESVKQDDIRFFACGEYGPRMGRPHYHVALFNYRPEDLEYLWDSKADGSPLYKSEKLAKTWGKGFVTVGEITAASAAYVARYVLKKADGKRDPKRYFVASYDETQEDFELETEFALMSRRPGIGAGWFEKYINDCRKDFLYIDGNPVPLPRFYKDRLSLYDEKVAKRNERARKRKRKEMEDKGEFDQKVLDQKEIVKKAQISLLRRGGENAKA